MERTHQTSVAKVAATTCTLVLALYYTLSTGYAGIDEKKDASKAHLTHVKVDGLVVNMALKKKAIKTGEKPEISMKIVNTSDKKVERLVLLQVDSIPKVSPMSRMAAFPRKVWATPVKVVLEPNQTKILDITAAYEKKMKEDLSISILADGKKLTPELSAGDVANLAKRLNAQVAKTKTK